jgi:phospholipid transport system substrate-binding protein
MRSDSMMSPKFRILNLGFIALLLFMFAPNAHAESPKDQLQGTIDSVIKVLRTIESREDIERNRKSLRLILQTRFDYAAMAQQSLGNRWVDLNGREKEFVAVFTDFLENSYMTTLGSYRGEKVVYDRDRIEGDAAEVDTRVVGGEGAPIKIDYKLHRTGEQWMVYDAVIDDVSVISNYRSQFARILRTSSLDALLQSLRAKVASH